MKNTSKILVLSDLKDSKLSVIRNAVSLAKLIDGNIHVFHVKKPTEIVEGRKSTFGHEKHQ